MECHKDLDVEQQHELEDLFLTTLSRLIKLFDHEPFRLPTTNRPSRPLYDALMIALSLEPDLNIEHRKSEILSALSVALGERESYDVLVGRGNTIEAIRQRVVLAGNILRA